MSMRECIFVYGDEVDNLEYLTLFEMMTLQRELGKAMKKRLELKKKKYNIQEE